MRKPGPSGFHVRPPSSVASNGSGAPASTASTRLALVESSASETMRRWLNPSFDE
jgi:hypothetical protein